MGAIDFTDYDARADAAVAKLPKARAGAGSVDHRAPVERPPTRAANAMPAVRLVRGDGVKLEPVHWLWRGYLPAAC